MHLPPSRLQSLAFYNLENLFDPEEAGHTLDMDYTPLGLYKWDRERYQNKIDNLGLVISQIGIDISGQPPAFLGVCEVENERCLKDLVRCKHLSAYDYRYVHFESDDPRGLDTAFLYRVSCFELMHTRPYKIDLNVSNHATSTRDILYVKGRLEGEVVHVLVNHWPSRLDGGAATKNRRDQCAQKLIEIVDDLVTRDEQSNIIVLGDFNENPAEVNLGSGRNLLFNLVADRPEIYGTAKYRGKWVTFDQILLNHSLMKNNRFRIITTNVFDPSFLVQAVGRFKGYPKRSFSGSYHLGGFSDHFPVYSVFKLESLRLPRTSTSSMS